MKNAAVALAIATTLLTSPPAEARDAVSGGMVCQFHHRRSDSKRSGMQCGMSPRTVLSYGARDLRIRLPRDVLRQRIHLSAGLLSRTRVLCRSTIPWLLLLVVAEEGIEAHLRQPGLLRPLEGQPKNSHLALAIGPHSCPAPRKSATGSPTGPHNSRGWQTTVAGARKKKKTSAALRTKRHPS
jgi:hypothetical protein